MSELFSTNPPTEMAIYWLQDESGEESLHFRVVNADGDVDWCGVELPITDQDLIRNGYKFGPKVPSAKELAELQDKAKKWDDTVASFVSAVPVVIADQLRSLKPILDPSSEKIEVIKNTFSMLDQ